MTEEASSISIEFVPKGMNPQPRKAKFNLKDDNLKDIIACWENTEEDFDIRIFINGILSANALIGATNNERITNLKTFLKTYWQKNQILLKDGKGFRKIITKHKFPS